MQRQNNTKGNGKTTVMQRQKQMADVAARTLVEQQQNAGISPLRSSQ
jgi:hypothetical protein